MESLVELFAALPVVAAGLLASFVAGLGTGVGAAAALFVRRLSASLEAAPLGFSAGVMLAATFFSLLLPGALLAGFVLMMHLDFTLG